MLVQLPFDNAIFLILFHYTGDRKTLSFKSFRFLLAHFYVSNVHIVPLIDKSWWIFFSVILLFFWPTTHRLRSWNERKMSEHCSTLRALHRYEVNLTSEVEHLYFSNPKFRIFTRFTHFPWFTSQISIDDGGGGMWCIYTIRTHHQIHICHFKRFSFVANKFLPFPLEESQIDVIFGVDSVLWKSSAQCSCAQRVWHTHFLFVVVLTFNENS